VFGMYVCSMDTMRIVQAFDVLWLYVHLPYIVR